MNALQRVLWIKENHCVTPTHVYGFFGEYRYLSNFHVIPVYGPGGFVYPSVENAYQASKILTEDESRLQFIKISPSQAKQLGRNVKLRSDWEQVKVHNMEIFVRQKFRKSWDDLAPKLLKTGDRYLEETNYWGDRFWGADEKHIGENTLGKILMQVRAELIEMKR